MKKTYVLFLMITILIGVTACGKKAPTWQEQYDLGVRYLSEGNYAEAIIAFTAAIEIDPKQAQAYVGRGDAYIGSGETEKTLSAAQADYELAIELDDTNAQAYLGLADVYIRRGEYEKALEILKAALDKTENNQPITDKIAEMESGSISDSFGNIRRMTFYNSTGNVISYQDWFYDEERRPIKTTVNDGRYGIFSYDGAQCCWYWYSADGILESYGIREMDKKWRPIRESFYDADNVLTGYREFEYDASGKLLKSFEYYKAENDEISLFQYDTYQYDGSGNLIRSNVFDGVSGEFLAYSIYTYDDNGKSTGVTTYDANGNIIGRQENR